jgi:UDP-N-acetylmuramoyl-tripeptide--D-alanyl-D-alanine ligase
VEAIADEKSTLIKALPRHGVAVLNTDDDRVWASRTYTNAPAIGVGFGENAAVRAVNVEDFLNTDSESSMLGGIRGTLVADGKQQPFIIPHVLGKPQVRALLSAAAVGLYYGMSLEDIIESAKKYIPPPGRMRLLPGIKKTIIIDDSYNASPVSMKSALETLTRVVEDEHVVRYAVLGDMRELGNSSPAYHTEIGQLVPRAADVLITVGVETLALGNAAIAAGLPKDAWIQAKDATEAGKILQDRIQSGDVILFKGSQNTIRLERAIKEIMAEPLRAQELLVRQSSEWDS